MVVHQSSRSRRLTIRPIHRQRCATTSGIICILYLRQQDAILAILYAGILITTTIAGQRLNTIIYLDDIKYITANGHTIIHVGDYSFHAEKFEKL